MQLGDVSPAPSPLQSCSHSLLAGTSLYRPQSSYKGFFYHDQLSVSFHWLSWHYACELRLIYMQVNGNKRLSLPRAVSKTVVANIGLCCLTSKYQSITVWFLQHDCTGACSCAWAVQISVLGDLSFLPCSLPPKRSFVTRVKAQS